jgi:hypothetical protein
MKETISTQNKTIQFLQNQLNFQSQQFLQMMQNMQGQSEAWTLPSEPSEPVFLEDEIQGYELPLDVAEELKAIYVDDTPGDRSVGGGFGDEDGESEAGQNSTVFGRV